MSRPRPVYWGINESNQFSHALSNLSNDLKIIYAEKIDNMIHSKNPVGHGDKWERTRYGQVWMVRLNDYYRFSYFIDGKSKTIHLIRLGSHKDVCTER